MERKTFRVNVVMVISMLIIMLMSTSTYAANMNLYSNTDLTQTTGMSETEFVEYCNGMKYDKAGFYKRNASYIYQCCKKYGFNELAFIGISAWEGGWCQHGNSYNYYGLGNYKYSSERDGINHFISYLTSNYLNNNGKYFNGKTIKAINVKYNTVNPDWYWGVLECAQSSKKRK